MQPCQRGQAPSYRPIDTASTQTASGEVIQEGEGEASSSFHSSNNHQVAVQQIHVAPRRYDDLHEELHQMSWETLSLSALDCLRHTHKRFHEKIFIYANDRELDSAHKTLEEIIKFFAAKNKDTKFLLDLKKQLQPSNDLIYGIVILAANLNRVIHDLSAFLAWHLSKKEIEELSEFLPECCVGAKFNQLSALIAIYRAFEQINENSFWHQSESSFSFFCLDQNFPSKYADIFVDAANIPFFIEKGIKYKYAQFVVDRMIKYVFKYYKGKKALSIFKDILIKMENFKIKKTDDVHLIEQMVVGKKFESAIELTKKEIQECLSSRFHGRAHIIETIIHALLAMKEVQTLFTLLNSIIVKPVDQQKLYCEAIQYYQESRDTEALLTVIKEAPKCYQVGLTILDAAREMSRENPAEAMQIARLIPESTGRDQDYGARNLKLFIDELMKNKKWDLALEAAGWLKFEGENTAWSQLKLAQHNLAQYAIKRFFGKEFKKLKDNLPNCSREDDKFYDFIKLVNIYKFITNIKDRYFFREEHCEYRRKINFSLDQKGILTDLQNIHLVVEALSRVQYGYLIIDELIIHILQNCDIQLALSTVRIILDKMNELKIKKTNEVLLVEQVIVEKKFQGAIVCAKQIKNYHYCTSSDVFKAIIKALLGMKEVKALMNMINSLNETNYHSEIYCEALKYYEQKSECSGELLTLVKHAPKSLLVEKTIKEVVTQRIGENFNDATDLILVSFSDKRLENQDVQLFIDELKKMKKWDQAFRLANCLDTETYITIVVDMVTKGEKDIEKILNYLNVATQNGLSKLDLMLKKITDKLARARFFEFAHLLAEKIVDEEERGRQFEHIFTLEKYLSKTKKKHIEPRGCTLY